MLLYLFVTFQFLHSVSCVITCHSCPLDENSFDYFVTADRIPDALNNCELKTIGDTCFIDVNWSHNPDKTGIALTARDDGRSILPEHTLNTNGNFEKKGTDFLWSRSISYTCSTDECNSLTVLKRVLSSLTLSDNFYELEYLLKSEEPVESDWCWLWANTTSLQCAIPPSISCKECSFQGMTNNGALEICANCLTDDIGETFLSHEVDFNMTDRTRADHWMLECRLKDCNTLDNGNLVRQKSTSDFDFVKFLDGGNGSTTLAPVSTTTQVNTTSSTSTASSVSTTSSVIIMTLLFIISIITFFH